MRALRMMAATVAASFLTVFAVLGVLHLVEEFVLRSGPSPIAVSERRIDFGDVPLNGAAARELVVRNDGEGPILARFVVPGTYRVEPREAVLAPGVEWSVTVVARPEKPGRMEDILQIQVVGARVAGVVISLAGVARDEAEERGLEWEMNRV